MKTFDADLELNNIAGMVADWGSIMAGIIIAVITIVVAAIIINIIRSTLKETEYKKEAAKVLEKEKLKKVQYQRFMAETSGYADK